MRISTHITILALLLLSGSAKQYAAISSTTKSRYEKWVEDIAYFETEFLNTAKTYTDEAKDSCRVILADVTAQINELSDFQIKLALARCVVLADNGHTTLPIRLTHKIPLRFYRFSDGIYVVRADSATSTYLGAKVLKIESMDIDQVEARLFPYIAGMERWKKFKTVGMIASPPMLHEVGVGTGESLTFTLLRGADTLTVTFAAQEVEQDRPWYEGWADLYPIYHNQADWTFIHTDTADLPLYLKHVEEGVFFRFLDEEKIAYFHVNGFWDQCPNIEERIEAFHEKLNTKRDYDVVIDLRFYTGGNYGYFTKLAKKPPRIIHNLQKVFLITSDKTYSAGIVTAARIKHFAKDKIIVVGEEVGDRLRFWAESKVCVLPHSGIRVYNPQKEHDWVDNKIGLGRTHFANYLYGVPAKDLAVDHEIGLSYQTYTEQKDPILTWIIRQER